MCFAFLDGTKSSLWRVCKILCVGTKRSDHVPNTLLKAAVLPWPFVRRKREVFKRGNVRLMMNVKLLRSG